MQKPNQGYFEEKSYDDAKNELLDLENDNSSLNSSKILSPNRKNRDRIYNNKTQNINFKKQLSDWNENPIQNYHFKTEKESINQLNLYSTRPQFFKLFKENSQLWKREQSQPQVRCIPDQFMMEAPESVQQQRRVIPWLKDRKDNQKYSFLQKKSNNNTKNREKYRINKTINYTATIQSDFNYSIDRDKLLLQSRQKENSLFKQSFYGINRQQKSIHKKLYQSSSFTQSQCSSYNTNQMNHMDAVQSIQSSKRNVLSIQSSKRNVLNPTIINEVSQHKESPPHTKSLKKNYLQLQPIVIKKNPKILKNYKQIIQRFNIQYDQKPQFISFNLEDQQQQQQQQFKQKSVCMHASM